MKIPFGKVIWLLEAYKKENGDLLVPARYCTAEGIKLGSIVQSIRSGKRRTTWREKASLARLGFVWKVR